MNRHEALKIPKLPETGPKLLNEKNINFNSMRLRMGKISPIKPPHFNNVGIFYVVDRYTDPFYQNLDYSFWSEKLMQIDPNKHALRAGKYGDLLVYEAGTEQIPFNVSQPKVIAPKDIRRIDRISSLRGMVASSGFVLRKHFPPYPLGNRQNISPEQLEQMLLAAEKNNEPQDYYHDMYGFAKVDPSLTGREVLVLTLDYRERENISMTDAVVIDVANCKLLPRVFYNLNPKQ